MTLCAAALALACVLLAAAPVPGDEWERAEPAEMGLDAALLAQAQEYALTGGGSGCIVRGGRLVLAWGDQAKRYDLKSTTKSIGVTALGLAIGDGLVELDDLARTHHPAFAENTVAGDERWADAVTLRHLATQTAGFEKPGGYSSIVFEPGTEWFYSDCGPNWLAECVTLAYGRDLRDVMFERVFTPLGITTDDLAWRENAYRPHEINRIKRREFGSGISANTSAMARIGLLYLRSGHWGEAHHPVELRTSPAPPIRRRHLPVQAVTPTRRIGALRLLWNTTDPPACPRRLLVMACTTVDIVVIPRLRSPAPTTGRRAAVTTSCAQPCRSARRI